MTDRLLGWAEAFDAWRIVPRLVLMGYGWIVWTVTAWFIGLEDPSGTQMGFASTVWGAAGVVTGWYMSTGRRWDGSPQHHLVRHGEYGSYTGPGPMFPPAQTQPYPRWHGEIPQRDQYRGDHF